MSLLNPPQLGCGRGKPGPVDADPNHSAWRNAASVELRENLVGGKPQEETRVRCFWTTDAWHVLFEAGARAPWATLTERDAELWTEEVVEVFVDPVGDGLSYFEIELNPLGTITDLILRKTASGWRKDFAWNVEGLVSAVRTTSGGWAGELCIPFFALTADEIRPGTQWRVNFLRIARPDGPGSEGRELSAWSPTGLANFHRYDRMGTVEFI